MGVRNSVTSCDLGVFVEEATEPVASDDSRGRLRHWPHRSLHGAAPLKPLPEPVDVEQYRVRKQAGIGGRSANIAWSRDVDEVFGTHRLGVVFTRLHRSAILIMPLMWVAWARPPRGIGCCCRPARGDDGVVVMVAGPAPRPQNQAAQSWTSGAKDLVMTALGTSTVWATMAHGIFTELYFPAVDQPQVKDFGFLVAAPGWWREVKRVDSYTLSTPGPTLALPTIVHTSTDPAAAYQLTLQPVVDPVNNAVLIAYDLQGDGVSLYPLLAPHLGICQPTNGPQAGLGADNSAWVDPLAQTMFAAGSGHYLCLLAAPGFSRAGVGYVGDTDGWTDFNRNTSMTLTYTQAGPGVVALTGELAGGSGLLAVGFADSQDAARAAAQASLDAGYPATCAAFTQGWQAWAADLTLPAPSRACRAGRRAAAVRCGAAHSRRPHRGRCLSRWAGDPLGQRDERPGWLPHGVVPGRRRDRAGAGSRGVPGRGRDDVGLPHQPAEPS